MWRASSVPGAGSGAERLAASPGERRSGALAGRCGSLCQQARRRFLQAPKRACRPSRPRTGRSTTRTDSRPANTRCVASPASRLAFMFARACCDQHGSVTACVCKQSPRRPIFASGGLLLLPHKRQPASPPRAGRRCRELVFRARVVATRRALRIPPARFECDVRQTHAVTTGPRRAASAESRGPRGPIRRWTRARPADVIDLFVYVVVLNLAIEYTPSVISESFPSRC